MYKDNSYKDFHHPDDFYGVEGVGHRLISNGSDVIFLGLLHKL